MSRRVLVLGSTGSVGGQALEVLDDLRETHRVVGLSAATSADRLVEQARRFAPDAVALVDGELDGLPDGCLRLRDPAELVEATAPDVVLCAITGAAGLPSTLAAAERAGTVALANKESLVLAGHLVKAAAARSGATIVPVDSEHSALFQCLATADRGAVRRLVLTASGGPFRGRSRSDLETVTPRDALQHPNWDMGPHITVNSATLMNKALEVIEAHHLFDVPPDLIDVVVHPQSVVHSMVEFVDGSMLAQLGPPDMKIPIRYALGYPDRLPSNTPPIDVVGLSGLTFEAPDRDAFACLRLGEQAARDEGLMPTVLNAANEVAIDAFLAGRLPFLAIADVVGAALRHFDNVADPDLPTILDTDRRAREFAAGQIPQPAS